MVQYPDNSPTQEALLRRIANRIRRSLELQEILTTTVAEVRAYLGTDRVKIYQFQPDGHGVVIAQSFNSDRLPSLLGLHFPADDIPLYARELYVRARQRTIVNLGTKEIGISPLNDSDLDEQSDIRYRPIDPCHQEYLTAMGVQSSMVVPIVLEGEAAGPYHPPSLQTHSQLWGLLISHHAEPHPVTEAELQFIQAVVDQVAIAISHSILLDRVRAQARHEASINQVTAFLQTSPNVNWQDTLQMAANNLEAEGRLYLSAADQLSKEIYEVGEQPDLICSTRNRPIEENLLWQQYLNSVVNISPDTTGYQPWSVDWMRAVYGLPKPATGIRHTHDYWAVNDIYQEPLFRTLTPFFTNTSIRSVLIIPLKQGTRVLGCLTFFRSGLDTETLWAGYHNSDIRQLMPRQSFEVWRQLNKEQAQGWTQEEVKYAQVLGERFAATIQQYRLFQQVQQLNQHLEQRVEERTAQLQLALSAAQMGTWEWDLTTDLKRWSPKCFALFGTDAAHHPVLNHAFVLSLIHPEDVLHFQQSCQQSIEANSLYECEFRVVWPDQTIHWLYERGNYTYSPTGEPIKLAGVCMDITDRKQAESVLRESEARFSKVFHASPIGIAITTVDEGRFIDINESCLQLLGYQKQEVLGRTTLEINFWEDSDKRDRLIQDLMQGEAVRNLEVLFQSRSGGPRTGILALERIELSGQPYIVTMLLDISDRKQAEKQLQVSLQEKEMLLKEIHHRVKNNLQIVSSLLRMQSQQTNDEQIKTLFNEAQGRVRSMALIHEQLYRSPDLANISLQDYLYTLIYNLFHSYGIDTAVVVPTIQAENMFLPIVTAIPCGLIVNELVSNALKFAFPQQQAGEVVVQIWQELSDDSNASAIVTLMVSDNGVGLPDSLQLEEVESVGLTIVKALVSQLQGTLTLGRDKGTCFQIVFPTSA